MGLFTLTCMVLLGAVTSQTVTAHATSSQINEIDRVLTEETTELIKSAAETQQQGTKKTASQTKWNRQMDETSVTRETYVGSGTTKIEIFYSSSSESPQLLLQAPSKKIYHPGATTAYEDTLIIYRKGYVVKEYPDIKYDILYISESQDPGMWNIAFTVDEDIDEFVVVTARVADDWQNFHTDYKTAPTDIIIWEMSQTSHYTANDITSIVAKDEVIPTNHITETVIIETESASPIIFAVIGLIILVIAGTVIAILSVNRAGKAKSREKSNAIKNANNRLKLKRKKENESLDKILESYQSQYSDDEYFASFNKGEPDDTEQAESTYSAPASETDLTNPSMPQDERPVEREQKNKGKSDKRPVATNGENNTERTNATAREYHGATRAPSVERETVNGGAARESERNIGNKNVTNNVNQNYNAPASTGKNVGNGQESIRRIEKGNERVEEENARRGQSQSGNIRVNGSSVNHATAPGAKRGAETYTNKDIDRSHGKFSSASPTIPEINPRGGSLASGANAQQVGYNIPEGRKPSWMIAAESIKRNQNTEDGTTDFF